SQTNRTGRPSVAPESPWFARSRKLRGLRFPPARARMTNNQMPTLTAGHVLDELAEHVDACTFPILDNIFVYPAATRLSAYSDRRHWALLIEVLGFNPNMGGHLGIHSAIYSFGNCLFSPDPG